MNRHNTFLPRLMKTLIQAVTVVALGCLSPGCRVKSHAAPISLFPESREVAGWTRSYVIRSYDAKSLWQYLDGDADRYIHAGVVTVHTSDYRYHDKVDVIADIYQMSAPAGAQKIFSSEPATGSQPIHLGDEGRIYPTSVVFRKGSYLVRLTAYEALPEVSQGLVDLARGIDARLRKVQP